MNKTEQFTLKDLLVNEDAYSFPDAFGIERKRAEEIADNMDKITKELMTASITWSAHILFKKASEAKIAKTAREVALIAYLIGTRVGEANVTNDMMKELGSLLPKLEGVLPNDKKSKYVN